MCGRERAVAVFTLTLSLSPSPSLELHWAQRGGVGVVRANAMPIRVEGGMKHPLRMFGVYDVMLAGK